MQSSLLNLLAGKEYFGSSRREEYENFLEDSFLKNDISFFEVPLPTNVSSTIAIALSHDNQYFATTHGDHTVKVFEFDTRKQIREFRGHPRTPWTVKFHPSDSDIIASGCLGCQVIIWSMRENKAIRMVRLDFSIISMSFHPSGEFLAVASGSRLELWEWGRQTRFASTTTTSCFLPINHLRNIRAVAFHPDGQYLFVAAPDAPRTNNDAVTYCSLYALPFAQWQSLHNDASNQHLVDDSNQNTPLNLTYHPVLLPQIHLYSDGGFDLSKDGRFLVTCARLFIPPLQRFGSAQVLTHSHYMDEFKLGMSPLSTTERMDEEEFVFANNSTEATNVLPLPPMLGGGRPHLSHLTEQMAMSVLRSTSSDIIVVNEEITKTRMQQYSHRQQQAESALWSLKKRLPWRQEPYHRPTNAAIFPSDSNGRQLLAMDANIASLGWRVDDYLCVFKLNFQLPEQSSHDHLPSPFVSASILNAKALPGTLMRAITSVKISLSNRQILLGYGVRSEDGHVMDHPNVHAACEVLNTLDASMSSIKILTDPEDEVNIAQFHSRPGGGLIYGTKRGRTRLILPDNSEADS